MTKAFCLEQLRGGWRGFTLTDKFAGLYGVALVLSYLCSDYREEAFLGAGNGWYMGFLPQLMLVAAYFFVARFWKPRKVFGWVLLGVSAVVFLLGYLNRFSFYPIKMYRSNPSFISTIGNINWYCCYTVTVLFVGVTLLWTGGGKRWQRALLGGYVLLGFGTLVTQGSASGLLALAIMLLFLFAMSADSGKKMWGFWLIGSLLSAACLMTGLLRHAAPKRMNYEEAFINLLTMGKLPWIMTIVSFGFCTLFYILLKRDRYPRKVMVILARALVTFVSCSALLLGLMVVINTLWPGSLGALSKYGFFTFSDTWGSSRGATWKAGFLCFQEQDILHKLLGVGPDAMAAYCYQDGSEELLAMLHRNFGELTNLTNAHNEWLTVLADVGILGLAGFGGMMLSAIRGFLGKAGKNDPDPVCAACGFALAAYTVNNIFSFQQTIGLVTMMMILGMGMAFRREKKRDID